MKEKKATTKKSGFRIFTMGLVAGAVGGALLGRKLTQGKRMPYLALWQKELEADFGEVKAATMAARIQSHYDELFSSRPRITKQALRWHLELNILPGLALYKVLREEKEDKDAALETFEALVKKSVVPLREVVATLNRIKDPFGGFRQAARWVMRLAFPSEGWTTEPVEDSESCLAFNIKKCFYLDMFNFYKAPELTATYCNMDDYMYETLPESISWQRKGTMGRGNDCCDFRWCRAKEASSE